MDENTAQILEENKAQTFFGGIQSVDLRREYSACYREENSTDN